MKKIFHVIVFFIVFACSVGQAAKLAIGEGQSPRNLNPLVIKFAVEQRLKSLVFKSMMGYDYQERPVPILFQNSDTNSDDLMEWKFKIAPGIKWNDGVDVSAVDFDFSRGVIANSASRSIYREFVTNIRSISELQDGEFNITFLRTVERPTEMLYFPIVPRHKFDDRTRHISENGEFGLIPEMTVGCGPYVFKAREGAFNRIMFERFEQYFGGWGDLPDKTGPFDPAPERIDKIVVEVIEDPVLLRQALMQGRFHLLPEVRSEDLELLTNTPTTKIKEYPRLTFSSFVYNMGESGNQFISEYKKVRQAIDMVIDRSGNLRQIYNIGEDIMSPDMSQILPGGPYIDGGNLDLSYRPYDMELAKRMLSELGFERGSDGILEKHGVKFEVRLVTHTRDNSMEQVCQRFVSNLEELGVKVDFQHMELIQYESEVVNDRKFDIAFEEFWFEKNQKIVRELFYSSSANNFIGYNNPDLDRLCDRISNLPDMDDELSARSEIHSILHDDVPYSFLFYLPSYAGYSHNRLKNFDPKGHDFYDDINLWYMVPEW